MVAKAHTNSRTGKSVNNLLTGVLSQFVILVLNFAVRYIFVQNIGYEYLGINSLFSSILTVLSVADLGFGSALGIVLYSSLSKKNEEEIAGLMNFFKKVYLIIGLIVTAVGLAITPFVQYLVNTDKEIPNLSLYFLLFLLNTVSSYFISYRAILIRADQKNSVVNNATTIVKLSKAVLEIAVLTLIPRLLGLTATYFFYLGVMVASTYAIGLITSVYAKKKYPYAFGNKIAVSEEKKKDIISTTKDLFVYRLCSAFSSPIDSIIISVFVGTLILGVYSNYLLIFTTLLEFICLISRNVISSVGNFVVEKPIEEQKKLYFEMQLIYFAIIIFCTINFVSLVSPFISLVFKEESTLSTWVVFLMGATLISRCIGELAIIFRETTRIYKKTKYISLFYTALHIGLSLLLGYYFGLEGILLGNVIAYFVTNFWFELIALFKYHFKSSALKAFGMFFYVIAITCGASVGMYHLTQYITAKGDMMSFVIAVFASLVISSLTLITLYPLDGFKSAYIRFKKIAIVFINKYLLLHKSKIIQICTLSIYVVCLTGLVLSRDLFGVNINKLIFFILFAVTVLICNKKNAIAVIMFTLPISPSLAELYILFFSIGYLAIISFKSHSIRSWLIMLSVPVTLFFAEIILTAIYGSIHFNLALRILVLLSLLSVIYYDKSLFNKKHLIAFVLGVLYLFVILGINWIIPAVYGVTHKPAKSWLTFTVLFREVRFGYSSRDWIAHNANIYYPHMGGVVTGENPNNIGLLSIISIVSLFSMYGTLKNRGKILSLIGIVILLAFGLWTQSRTYIIFLAAFIPFAVLMPFAAKRKNLISTLIYLFVILTVITIVVLSSPDFLKNIISRFNEKTTATGGDRLTLIGGYLSFTFSDWRRALFGVGCSNLQTLSGLDAVPHTNFVQFLGAYGLIIFLLFLALFVVSIIKTKKMKFRSTDLYLLLPLLFTTGFTFTLQLFLPSIVLISFVPGVLCFSCLGKNISEEKKVEYLPSCPVLPNSGERERIAMCATSFGGGIGSYIRNISPFIIKEGISLSLNYNLDTTVEEENKYVSVDAKIYKFNSRKSGFKPKRLLDKFNYYLNSFYDFKPHVIYINTSSYTRALVLLCAALNYKGAKIIIHCHNAVNTKSKLPLIEKIIRWFVTFEPLAFFACSIEAGKVFYGKKFPATDDYDSVITNFIDSNKFEFSNSSREEIRTKLSFSSSDIVLGNVGRYDVQKNQKFIINLVSALPEEYKAVIVAGGGILKEELLEQAKSLNVSNRVSFVDSTSEIAKYYCAFDYFVLPSLYEGLPFVSVEAQCCGLKNISNDELPRSTDITGNVEFLPLNVDEWKNYIISSKPCDSKERLSFKSKVDEAGFSNITAPIKIVKTIRKVIYE